MEIRTLQIVIPAGSVGPGERVQYDIPVSRGVRTRVLSLRAVGAPPTGQTSGDQQVSVGWTVGSPPVAVEQWSVVPLPQGSALGFTPGTVEPGANVKTRGIFENLVGDVNHPLWVAYANSTNVTQDNEVRIDLVFSLE